MEHPTVVLGAAFAAAFRSGMMIDLILLLVGIEALLLHWLRRRFGRGPGLRAVWPTILSGALLMLAVRAALTHAWWGWIGLLLALGGLDHVLDLILRGRQAAGARAP